MEERIILQAEGNGLIKKMYAESNAVGEVRGFVQNPQATLNFSDGNSSLSDGLGLGLLQVSRVLYNRNEPVTGVVELIKSDISTDLAYYLTQSEQIPSAVLLDVSVDENGLVEESGGLLVQAMPGASVEEIQSIQDSIRSLKSLTALFKSGYSPDEVIKIVLGDTPEELKSTPVDFFCRCSMKRFKQQLITLPKEEIEGMQAEGQNELVCQYCNEKYLLSDDDFREILAEKMAASN
jgi:molecular chaperone Hsp33